MVFAGVHPPPRDSQYARTNESMSTAASWGRMAKTMTVPMSSSGQLMRSRRPMKPATASPIPMITIASFPTLEGQYQSEGKSQTHRAYSHRGTSGYAFRNATTKPISPMKAKSENTRNSPRKLGPIAVRMIPEGKFTNCVPHHLSLTQRLESTNGEKSNLQKYS